MAQMNWVFLDDYGGRHKVGLYHGDRSGHVMVHCNLRVVQIDFSVKETKMYSFFIEDELCELILEKQVGGGWGYEFRANKKVDTPLNQIRRAEERGVNKQMAMLIGGFVLGLVLVVFGLRRYGQYQEEKRIATTSAVGKYSKKNMKRLAAEGKGSVARLHLVLSENPGEQRISYTLLAVDSLMEQGDFKVKNTNPMLLPNGFPFSEGDEFEAIYLPSDPQVHRVEFFQPTRTTTTTYLHLAIQAEQENHPTDSAEKNVCRVLTTAQLLDWPCLAHFVFQEKTPAENARHNHNSYSHMLRDSSLSKVLRAVCLDK